MTNLIPKNNSLPDTYVTLLSDIKDQIGRAQVKAALAANQELIKLYWEIGRKVLDKQENSEWGSKILESLAKDLKSAFPNMKGFSLRNLKYMRQFAKAYHKIGQQAVAQIPWGHNIVLLEKLEDNEERLWYAKKPLNMGGVAMFCSHGSNRRYTIEKERL